MKNTIRAPRKVGTNASVSQSKTPLSAEAIREKLARCQPAPTGAVPKYFLSLIEDQGDGLEKICGEIDVTDLQFEILQKKSNLAHDPGFNKALKNALEMMIENDFCELENATAQSNALLQLLAEHMELDRMDTGISSFTNGKESGPLTYGIFQLISRSQDRLTKAIKGN